MIPYPLDELEAFIFMAHADGMPRLPRCSESACSSNADKRAVIATPFGQHVWVLRRSREHEDAIP